MSTPYKTVAFHTLGCKLNFSESSTIARNFIESGYRTVDFNEPADVYLINTCTVTDNADRKCRKAIRQIKNRSPESIIAVTGCYAQLKPDEISEIEGINLIVDNGEKFDIPSHIEKTHFNGKPVVIKSNDEAMETFHSSFSMNERTRAFLKVQDGCDYPCSYCTIPLARGRSRSDSMENILRQVSSIIEDGIKEIVLTGVNVGEFLSPEGDNFYQLLRELEHIPNLDRLRLSSIEPNLLTDEIIEFIASSRTLVPHFHIPMQSGTDRILKLMKRRYNTELYANRIAKIKSLLPQANIGADVIVGFPGETHEDFQETKEFISSINLSYLHVFSYSPREKTAAYQMAGVVPQNVIMNRSKLLHGLSDLKQQTFYENFVGTIHDVLFESCHDEQWIGHTRNFIKVNVFSSRNLENQIIPVRLTQNCNSYTKGEIQ